MKHDGGHLDADMFHATIGQIHEFLPVQMREWQGAQEGGPNREQTPAANIQEELPEWLDGRHMQTLEPTRKLDCKGQGPY